MRKVAILGCGGAGKSMLARKLGEHLNLPVTHLDSLYYDQQWNPLAHDEFARHQNRLVAGQCWILDGNYTATMSIRLAAADTVVFLDLHPLVCLWGVLWRRYQHRRGPRGRARDQSPVSGRVARTDPTTRHLRGRLSWGFVRYILRYRRVMRPRVQALLDEHATGTVVTLTSRRAARGYLRAAQGQTE